MSEIIPMLEEIDRIDWQRIHGPYGTVPELPDIHLDRPRIIRRAAAVALVTLVGADASPAVLGLLIEGTEDDKNLAADTERLGWPWNAPSLKGVYWRVIHAMGL
jgi:hypothetical protein